MTKKQPVPRALVKLRKLCLALPGTVEKTSWGAPVFRSPKRIYAMFADAKNHHGGGRHGVWIMAAEGRQARAMRTAPDRFFVPPYVGPSGWIGVWLDDVCRWDELADILKSAHELAEGPVTRLMKRKA